MRPVGGVSVGARGCRVPHYNVRVRELFEPERPCPFAPGPSKHNHFFDGLKLAHNMLLSSFVQSFLVVRFLW